MFVDPAEVTGLPLTKAAGVILPAFLLSDVYRDLVTPVVTAADPGAAGPLVTVAGCAWSRSRPHVTCGD